MFDYDLIKMKLLERTWMDMTEREDNRATRDKLGGISKSFELHETGRQKFNKNTTDKQFCQKRWEQITDITEFVFKTGIKLR